MKKSFFILFLLSIICLTVYSQTKGELAVSVTTSETGGNYAPRNIVAIWIEDETGNFVKTLAAYADRRKTHLNTWQSSTNDAGSEFNAVDAITGATRSNHGKIECAWNTEDYNGNLVKDGNYSLCMELTDKNSTGNYSTFAFTKSDKPEILTPSNQPSFNSISINWQPESTVNVEVVKSKISISIFPNPANNLITINGENIMIIELMKMSGEVILKTNLKRIDVSNLEKGIYLISVETDKGRIIKKLLKE